MWYPEETITYCSHCDFEIPLECFWRGRGVIIGGSGQKRLTVLYSWCPGCGRQRSAGLEGPWWYRVLYGWLWKLRYPRTRPPEQSRSAARQPKRRASGS